MSAMSEIHRQIKTGEIKRYVCEACGHSPESLDWEQWEWNGHYWVHKHKYGNEDVYLEGSPS